MLTAPSDPREHKQEGCSEKETDMRRIAGLALALSLILGAAVPAAARQNSKHDHHNSTLFATGQLGTALLAIDVERGTTKVIGPTGQPGSIALAITRHERAAYRTPSAAPGCAPRIDRAHPQRTRVDGRTGAATSVA